MSKEGNESPNHDLKDFGFVSHDDSGPIKIEGDTLETKVKEEKDASAPPATPDLSPKIRFHCYLCDLSELVHYYGKEPPFLYGIEFLEDYCVRWDPQSMPPPPWKPKAEFFVALGAKCSICDKQVCKDSQCSYFYTKTTCTKCLPKIYKDQPIEIQAKIRKLIQTFKLDD